MEKKSALTTKKISKLRCVFFKLYELPYDTQLFCDSYVPVTAFSLALGLAATAMLTDPFAPVVIGPDGATGTVLESSCESTS